ncbi:glycosyltransferase family 4 protein [Mucilaginibacter sp. OK098]|uniref:glycosyltransferase family 4 protein n=1 Tax=Mucilaginibacter sp. OK098 TaxID=1855297 RepID=UPI000913848A|nr:glycosyltransferase family 4 protein [Mucilaginibacter sp. OK098]SHN27804.1 Glycosyltransferase involved in cell wall bisynthesis [Mucilaginibacter sp. OK098]
MNILYLCDEYPPGKHGGIGTYVRLIARQMVKLGHKVIVAGLYGPGYGGANEFNDEGVTVYRFRRGFNFRFLSNETSLRSRIGTRLLKDSGLMERDIKKSLAIYKDKLEQLIVENKIDIIEMPDYNDYIRFCSTYVPFPALSVPVVVKMNGSMTYFAREANLQAPAHVVKMEQTILNKAAAISSASSYTADKSAVYLSYNKAIEVLYNGIQTDLPARNVPKNPKQVIFTGTLVAKKGIYQLAKAWNIVYKSMPDARLLILGKGSQQKVIAQLTDDAKASVSFMGHVITGELYDHLAASAISIFPSYAEAFALAPLEAMACGTAVINSNRTSGPELIDDRVNGLLIDPDDVGQIASAILYLLNNPVDRARLAKAGNEKVRELFEISKIAAKTIQFYKKVLKY